MSKKKDNRNTVDLEALTDKFLALSIKQQFTIIALVAIVAAGAYLWHSCSNSEEGGIGLETSNQINVTPEQIVAIEAIGQWEFLSISDEELVDTTRKNLLSDDHLVRIYYGTLRLGVDLHKAKDGWIKVQGDTIVATLPRVDLLDDHFIDEARTKSFYATGKWSGQDLEAMYRRAYRQMKQHTLTPENLQSAEQNAEAQFRQMFKTMGYNNITIRFE